MWNICGAYIERNFQYRVTLHVPDLCCENTKCTNGDGLRAKLYDYMVVISVQDMEQNIFFPYL